MTRPRARAWLRRLGWVAVMVLVAAGAGVFVRLLRDPAIRDVPLGPPTPWPTIVLEEAAAPSAPRWAALARSRPPPRAVRACIVPHTRMPLPTFGDVRYCGRALGQAACPRRTLDSADRARSCAVHASRVAEALLRRGSAEMAWHWFTEARILLGLGAGVAADPATALDLSLRIRQLDLDLARLLPWYPEEEALQGIVAGLPPVGDTASVRAVRAADWSALVPVVASSDADPVWHTDSVAVAVLARSWRRMPDPGVMRECPRAGYFWSVICGGALTARGDRDPPRLDLDVAREDARAYRRAQRQRVDSLLQAWAARQPGMVPSRLTVLGSDSRIGRFLLRRASARGMATPWPPLVSIDVGRSIDRIASTLAHELGHHAQFRSRGAWGTLRLGDQMREAEADAWGRAFLCLVGGARLGRLGGRCPELVAE